MSYLKIEEYEEIADTVDVYPILDERVGDISQYSFHSGDAVEYEIFFYKKAIPLELLGITRTHLLIHNKTKELIGYFSLAVNK